MHGGDVTHLRQRLGTRSTQLLDFSANLNPLPLPLDICAAVLSSVDELAHYPDPQCRALNAAIAAWLAIDPRWVVSGNGSEQLIWWLPRALQAQRVVLNVPAYLDYQRAAALWELPVVELPLDRERDFALDLATLAATVQPGDLVWIGHPNNPTGRLAELDVLKPLIAAHPKVWWAVDEAFIDFVAAADSALQWQQPNVIVARSLTKIFALPGLRLGFMVMPPALAVRLHAHLPAWSVNTFAQVIGTQILSASWLDDYLQTTRCEIAKQREQLSGALTTLGIRVTSGCANYLLLELPLPLPSAPVIAETLLMQHAIAVRVCTNYNGLNERFVRIAIRSEQENQHLIAALQTVLA